MLHMLEERQGDIIKFKKLWYRVKQEILTEAGATDEAGRIDETIVQCKLLFDAVG